MFYKGFARVRNNDRWGIIDKTGKVVVEIIYDEIGDYYKNTTWAKNGTSFGLIIAGKFKAIEGVDKIWDFLAQDITYAKKNEKIGFIDLKGNWVIEPKFDKARAFVKNLAPVQVGKKWGYINTKGAFLVEPIYNDAEIFSTDGFAPVKDKEWGFINETGKLVVPCEYGITAGLFAMFKDDEKGFVNGLARVISKKKYGFIKPDGKVLGDQWFDSAEPFKK